eukprot:UN1501
MIESGLTPNAVVYDILINAAAQVRDVRTAERYYKEMLAAGVQPDVVGLNSLISLAGKTRDLAAAERWWSEMSVRGLTASMVSYTTMMNAYVKAGLPGKAEALFRNMESCSVAVDEKVFGVIVDGYAKAGDVVNAEKWSDILTGRGYKPSVVLFTQLMDCYANAKPKEVDKAEALLQYMSFVRVTPNAATLNSLKRAVGSARFKQLCEQYGYNKGTRMSDKALAQERFRLRSDMVSEEMRDSPVFQARK